MESNRYYHIYNHANGNENIFRNSENNKFFLARWSKYIEPIADTYAYCLMPNHIHFLIRTKAKTEIDLEAFKNLQGLTQDEFEKRISQQFSNLFNSYTKSYNKMYIRRGSLFAPNFNKKPITSEQYLRKAIHYIHHNPVKHGFVSEITTWQFSSYNTIISTKPTLLQRKKVIELFDTLDNFIYCHQHPLEITGID